MQPNLETSTSPTVGDSIAGAERLMEQGSTDGSGDQCSPAAGPPVQTCCLLCHRERKDWGLPSPRNGMVSPSDKLVDFVPPLAQNLLGEVPLWICQSCRKSVEEEERRAAQEQQALGVSLSHTSCKGQSCEGGSHTSSSSSSSSSSCHGDWDPSSFLSAHKLSGLWNSQHLPGQQGEAFHSSEHHRHSDLTAPPNSPTGFSSQHSSLVSSKQMSPHQEPLEPSQHVHSLPSPGVPSHIPFPPPLPNSHTPAAKITASPPVSVHKPGTCKNSHLPPPTSLSKMPVPSSCCSHPCNGHCNGSVTPQNTVQSANVANSRDQVCKAHRCTNGTSCHPPQSCDADEGLGEDEDSSSERSSCTSSSTNQKDGKYCDCCYCEFFGHNAPPAAPTSRNYTEIREKLRSRLTKRKEELPSKEDPSGAGEPAVDPRNVDELLDFINSSEPKPVNSAKAAKRARHRQKKKEKEKSHAEMDDSKCDDSSSLSLKHGEPQAGGKLLDWPQLELERVNNFLTSRLEEIKNTIKDSIRASFSMYDLNLDVNDFPKKAATLEQKNLLSHLNGSSDMQPIDLDLSPLTLGTLKNHAVNSGGLSVKSADVKHSGLLTAVENSDIKRLNTTPSLSRLVCVESPERTSSSDDSSVQSQGDNLVKEGLDLKEQAAGINKQKKTKKQNSQGRKNDVNRASLSQQKAEVHGTKPSALGAKIGLKQTVASQSSESQKGSTVKKCEEPRGVRQASNGAPGSARAEKKNLRDGIRADLEQESGTLSATGEKNVANVGAPGSCSSPKGRGRKGRGKGDKSSTTLDDVFLPKDLDAVEMDETDREVEYFKKFCLDSAKQTRQKVAVNWSNFSLKKASSNAAQ